MASPAFGAGGADQRALPVFLLRPELLSVVREEATDPLGGVPPAKGAGTRPHRHVVFAMPRLLRGIFRKRRELLLDLAQCCAEALSEYMRTEIGSGTRTGIMGSIATSGDLMQWHPHGHLLVTDGAFADAGAFRPVKGWNGDAVMKLFRECLLARLIERHAVGGQSSPADASHVPRVMTPQGSKMRKTTRPNGRCRARRCGR
jgi:hypothetical protein